MSYASNNLLILHPDTLVSATRASDAHFCRRKAVLQEKVRSSSESSPALVYGNLLHELFQSCFLAMAEPSDAKVEDKVKEAFSLHRREAEIDRLLKVPKNIESLFTIHVELDEARNHLREKSVTFAEFANMYIGQLPKVGP
jgi:DNA replication ATP-dependent helicase Dna2